MPRPIHNPFKVSEADSSIHFMEEEEARRLRKKYAMSCKRKKVVAT